MCVCTSQRPTAPGSLNASSGNRPRSPGASKARPDTLPGTGRTPPGAQPHRVRIAPPSRCQHLAANDAQLVDAVIRARGDAHDGHDGAPSSIGVRTGTADSLSPRHTPRGMPGGSPHPARATAARATSEMCSAPHAFAEAESRTPRCVRSRMETKGFVLSVERHVRDQLGQRCTHATFVRNARGTRLAVGPRVGAQDPHHGRHSTELLERGGASWRLGVGIEVPPRTRTPTQPRGSDAIPASTG
jgi:hypothetical protein